VRVTAFALHHPFRPKHITELVLVPYIPAAFCALPLHLLAHRPGDILKIHHHLGHLIDADMGGNDFGSRFRRNPRQYLQPL
jgi:hypothetical protein